MSTRSFVSSFLISETCSTIRFAIVSEDDYGEMERTPFLSKENILNSEFADKKVEAFDCHTFKTANSEIIMIVNIYM